MSPIPMRSLVRGFKPYTAGLSIDEIREKYGIERVIKLASNENPLGTSPLVQHTLETHVGLAFRYPQAGNPRLVKAIAAHHGVSPPASSWATAPMKSSTCCSAFASSRA